jgi:GWxTD domain-containing protein
VPLLVRGEEPVTLEVVARVRDSSRRWRRELNHAPDVLASLPVWITAVRGPEPGALGELELTASRDSLRLEVSLQRRLAAHPWPESGLALVGEVSGAAGGRPTSRRRSVPADLGPGQTRSVPVVWPTEALPFGRCRIQLGVELTRDGAWVRLPHEPALTLINLRVPVADDLDWSRHLDWLVGVVTAARRDSLRGLPAAARPEAWAAIWRDVAFAEGLDPEGAETRHLRRVVAADDRFGGMGRGAESDRGRALIRWGEPARIETYADARAAGAVWEVWDYPDRGRRLYFYDAYGLGDFRLRREEDLPR